LIGKEINIWEFVIGDWVIGCKSRKHAWALRSRMVTHLLLLARQMALTRAFREKIYRRAQQDGAFRKALLTEAVNAYLGDDEVTESGSARRHQRDHRFEQLAAELEKPSKSLHRMLGPGGNPKTANFFAILQVLQRRVGVKLIYATKSSSLCSPRSVIRGAGPS